MKKSLNSLGFREILSNKDTFIQEYVLSLNDGTVLHVLVQKNKLVKILCEDNEVLLYEIMKPNYEKLKKWISTKYSSR